MSVNSHYDNLISSCKKHIASLQDENTDLSAQEEIQQKLLSQKIWATYYLEKDLRNYRYEMNSFLRKNGGAFNLNDEQQAYYSQMMTEYSNIRTNWTIARSEKYDLAQGVTSLYNKISSNNLSIFNNTLDLGDYKNQLIFYSHISQKRELG